MGRRVGMGMVVSEDRVMIYCCLLGFDSDRWFGLGLLSYVGVSLLMLNVP
jgi:hypothetical protein